MLRRTGLARRRERLALREHHSAGTCGLLTERTRRRLAAARSARHRTSRRRTWASWSASMRSTSASSRASARCGQITACDGSKPADRCGASSRTVARSSKRRSPIPAATSVSRTRGHGRAMRGPTVSSSGSRARSARTLASRVSSPVLHQPPRDASQSRWLDKVLHRTGARTRVTGCTAARLPTCSPVR
jgi:hypothetical protein